MESELVFNDVKSVPDPTNVTKTMVEAASSNSSSFSDLGVDASSVKAERKVLV